MGFKTKEDYFGLSDTSMVVTNADDGRSAKVAEAVGSDGSIVDSTVYGEELAPSNDFELKSNKTFSSIQFGDVKTYDSTYKLVLNNFTVTTTAGRPPAVSASGVEVESTATTGCTYTLPSLAVEKKHHAQILASAFTLTGDGCHLVGATYTASCNVSKATKDGACLTFDVNGAKVEVSVEIRQVGSSAPTLTAGTGWVITSPLSSSNPDADYPTYTATVTKYLTKDTQSAS